MLFADQADVCLGKRGARCGYAAQQKANAKRLALETLVPLAERHGWRYTWHAVDLVWRFLDTDSTIEIFGMDDPRAIRLIRGRAWDRFAVDEAQDFLYTDLQHLCMRVLGPALAERRGVLTLAGTPGDVENYFHAVVWARSEPEWAVVLGEFLENPNTAAALAEEIEQLVVANPGVIHEPWFQREYLGQWVADSRQLVIQVDERNLAEARAWAPTPGDHFALGIDFGFRDPSAYVVGCWNPLRAPRFTYVEAVERREMYLHDHLALLEDFRRRYPGIRIFADPAGHAAALHAELRDVHGVPLEDAAKQEKRFHLERLNSESVQGLIQFAPGADLLYQQWRRLSWTRGRAGEREEGTPRHLSDAGLYARRGAYLWLCRDPQQEPTVEERQLAAQRSMRDRRSEAVRERHRSRRSLGR